MVRSCVIDHGRGVLTTHCVCGDCCTVATTIEKRLNGSGGGATSAVFRISYIAFILISYYQGGHIIYHNI